MTIEGHLKYNRGQLLDFGLLALVFSIPLHRNFSTVTLGIVLAMSLFGLFRDRKFPEMRMHWFLPTLFLYYVLSHLLSDGLWSSIERKLTLILVPIACLLNPGFLREEIRKKVCISFILGTAAAVVTCMIRAVVRSLSLVDGQWHFNPKVIQDSSYDFLTSSVMGGNFFFGSEFSWFAHTTYFGLYIVFAQVLIYEISKFSKDRKEKLLLAAGYLLLMVPLFLLSSRAAIITSVMLTFFIFFQSRIPRKLRFPLLFSIVAGSVFLFMANPRLRDLREGILRIEPKAKYGHALRILSWDASLQIIKSHWLVGLGEGNKEAALVEAYTSKGYDYPAEQKFNSHNQYFDFLLGGGIVALALFLAGMVQLLWRSMNEGNFPLTAFLTIFLLNSLVENLLGLYAGISFFSVFIGLLGTKQR